MLGPLGLAERADGEPLRSARAADLGDRRPPRSARPASSTATTIRSRRRRRRPPGSFLLAYGLDGFYQQVIAGGGAARLRDLPLFLQPAGDPSAASSRRSTQPDFFWQAEALRRAARRRAAPRLLSFYTHEPDTVQHLNWKWYQPERFFGVRAADVAARGGEIERLHREFDRFLGELLERVDERTVLMVVSDHGHSPTILHQSFFTQHRHGPPGILLACGGPVRAGARIDRRRTCSTSSRPCSPCSACRSPRMPPASSWPASSTSVSRRASGPHRRHLSRPWPSPLARVPPAASSARKFAKLHRIRIIVMSSRPPFLEHRVPAYNEAARLPQTLPRVQAFAEAQPYPVEVLVVDNASTDGAGEIAERAATPPPCGCCTKRSAARAPRCARARSPRRANGSSWPTPTCRCRSRRSSVSCPGGPATPTSPSPAAKRRARALRRTRAASPDGPHLQPVGALVAVPGVADTQCGFKCFRRAVARDLFARQTVSDWTFNVEILFLARRPGYRIFEVPIHWTYKANSRVNPLRDALKMAAGVVRIRWNAMPGKYGRRSGLNRRPRVSDSVPGFSRRRPPLDR